MTDKQPIPWSTREIIEATGGDLVCGDEDRRFPGIVIDSREISTGNVFVAIIGERLDGHQFVSAVIDQGGRGLVIERQKAAQFPLDAWKTQNVTCVTVDDTTRALGNLAAFNRRRTRASVAAITGSNGKTTTRKLTAGVVSSQFSMLATAGNFNNQIGLPLTLLGLSPEHQWAVVELGSNNPGEIARLAEICKPDIGVLTNIGPAHLEGLGSLDGVMREKGDLINGLGPGGKAVLNADDPRVLQLARETNHEVLLYGQSPEATIRAENVKEDLQTISFTLVFDRKRLEVGLNSPGTHMVSNALAAAAVGYLLGISAPAVKAGLESFKPVSGRMNISRLPNGVHIIDDTYNANPGSMKAALAALKQVRSGGRTIFVAGDMLELGAQAAELHGTVGSLAAQAGVERLYACGDHAAALAEGSQKAGLPAANTRTGSRDEIMADLIHWLRPGDWVLIKGSRSMAMEKVVQGLKEWAKESRG